MNKTTRIILAFVGLALIGAASEVLAQEAASSETQVTPQRRQPRVRQARQHHRVREGVRRGELTKTEAQTLRQEQREIQETKKEMLSDDGQLDKSERQELKQLQNEASQNIYQEKHDSEKR